MHEEQKYALREFKGSALVISHDRWFLDRVCTATLAFEGNSIVKYFDGPWSEYERHLKDQGASGNLSGGNGDSKAKSWRPLAYY